MSTATAVRCREMRGTHVPTQIQPDREHPGVKMRVACGVVEWTLLLVAIAVVGFMVVPAHWTSIWMDREFTGWVAPIANRMHQGLKLYGADGHIPMPPLPFVLLEAVCGGQATWMSESLANFFFQSLMLL